MDRNTESVEKFTQKNYLIFGRRSIARLEFWLMGNEYVEVAEVLGEKFH